MNQKNRLLCETYQLLERLLHKEIISPARPEYDEAEALQSKIARNLSPDGYLRCQEVTRQNQPSAKTA